MKSQSAGQPENLSVFFPDSKREASPRLSNRKKPKEKENSNKSFQRFRVIYDSLRVFPFVPQKTPAFPTFYPLARPGPHIAFFFFHPEQKNKRSGVNWPARPEKMSVAPGSLPTERMGP